MRVMVTGAAGLFGVHMVDKLVKRPDVSKVYGVDNFSRNFFQKDPFIKSPEFEKKFVLIRKNYKEIDTHTLNLLEIDTIIHFAAYVSIDESIRSPFEYFENNEIATFHFIQNIFKTKQQPKIIYASSPEVYGNPKKTPMNEEHPMNPRSVYAATKLGSEKHCMVLFEWYGYPVNVIRNFNTYGENQNVWGYSAVIPAFIESALKGKPLRIQGDGKNTRDFLYVKDAVDAYDKLFSRTDIKGEIFNIGTGKHTSILELAKLIQSLAKSNSEIIHMPPRKGDLFALEADISKIKEKLGWEPEHTLGQGLTNTINWYRQFLNNN